MKALLACVAVAAALVLPAGPCDAHGPSTDASAVSMLPVAVSVAAPVMLLASGAALTVVSVGAVAEGTVWVLERASDGDGARASITLAGAASVAAGTVVVCTAFSAGWVLSAAGKAIAYVPNQIGQALLYNERVTR